MGIVEKSNNVGTFLVEMKIASSQHCCTNSVLFFPIVIQCFPARIDILIKIICAYVKKLFAKEISFYTFYAN